MMAHSPADIVAAHQYCYYVLADTIWSDRVYDDYCKLHGIEGGGGSDRAQDYAPHIITLANEMIASPIDFPAPGPRRRRA